MSQPMITAVCISCQRRVMCWKKTQLKGFFHLVSSSWRKHSTQRENSLDIMPAWQQQEPTANPPLGGNLRKHNTSSTPDQMHLQQMGASCFELPSSISTLPIVGCMLQHGPDGAVARCLRGILCDSHTSALRVQLVVFMPLPHGTSLLSIGKHFQWTHRPIWMCHTTKREFIPVSSTAY